MPTLKNSTILLIHSLGTHCTNIHATTPFLTQNRTLHYASTSIVIWNHETMILSPKKFNVMVDVLCSTFSMGSHSIIIIMEVSLSTWISWSHLPHHLLSENPHSLPKITFHSQNPPKCPHISHLQGHYFLHRFIKTIPLSLVSNWINFHPIILHILLIFIFLLRFYYVIKD